MLSFRKLRTKKLNGPGLLRRSSERTLGRCERVNLKEQGWRFFLEKDYLLGVKVGESATARKAVLLSRTFSRSMVAEGTELRSLIPHLGDHLVHRCVLQGLVPGGVIFILSS